VQGTRFDPPGADAGRAYLVGDLASVPALNSLLDHLGERPASIWLEYAHEDERTAPLRTRPQHEVTWVPRLAGGGHLVTTVQEGVAGASADDWFWIACEAASTRALTRHLRKERGIDKGRVDALAYWREVAAP
jgi:NADPH-dependent ferric siderophore reductase